MYILMCLSQTRYQGHMEVYLSYMSVCCEYNELLEDNVNLHDRNRNNKIKDKISNLDGVYKISKFAYKII